MDNARVASPNTTLSRSGAHAGQLSEAATVHMGDTVLQARIDVACEAACQAIAPAWPLDRAIAVNPYWERIERPLRQVAARMALLGDIRVFPTRSYIRKAWQSGRIGPADLAYALGALPATKPTGLNQYQCIEALSREPILPRLPLLIDVLDDDPRRHLRLSWRQAITHQVSQTCAAYFDVQQADWQPERGQGLYAFWRDTLVHDHGIGVLMGLPHLGRSLNALPDTRREAEYWVLQRLGLPHSVWPDYLEAVLLTVNGWASWCAYLQWDARLAGRTDLHLRDLLAIRLAWGAILLDCKSDAATRDAFSALQEHWREAASLFKQAEDVLLIDEVWQLALEVGYQRELAQKLVAATPLDGASGADPAIAVQAAFCIDIRSEPLRRAVESVCPAIQTIGCAGFFGLPIAYTPIATAARRPQLPGLLAPALEVTDRITPAIHAQVPGTAHDDTVRRARRTRLGISEQWRAARRWPSSAFSFVEAAGLGYLGNLARWLKPSTQSRARDDLAGVPERYHAACRPSLTGMGAEAKADLAAGVLQAMGVAHHLAPLVLLVGHGSQSANNAHAAALDCGACCGQAGEVNARVLAQILNDPSVRNRLARRGIEIPEETVFVAALHNTATDEIEGFDIDLIPPAARERWVKLQGILTQAGDQVRRLRAPDLCLDARLGHDQLFSKLRGRANDGAQTRTEWGLAGNAAFIIARRHRSLGTVLDGRCFLHDYDAGQDTDGRVLELLMTAPMVVAHWINWQYHASTCDPLRMGSGNKLLHNVVGGHIGVFEGNGGDLRIGLAKQSLHDGARWTHEPLRLTVIIDAPQQAIESVILRHATVRRLVNNGWLHLWRFGDAELLRYVDGLWQPLSLNTGQCQSLIIDARIHGAPVQFPEWPAKGTPT